MILSLERLRPKIIDIRSLKITPIYTNMYIYRQFIENSSGGCYWGLSGWSWKILVFVSLKTTLAFILCSCKRAAETEVRVERAVKKKGQHKQAGAIRENKVINDWKRIQNTMKEINGNQKHVCVCA